jgi:hypothetical protein
MKRLVESSKGWGAPVEIQHVSAFVSLEVHFEMSLSAWT